MMNRKFLPLAVVLAIVACLWACSKDSGVAGTATDTENTVAGVVKTASGMAARHASVRLISGMNDFGDRPTVQETFTDSVGVFAFDSVDTDTFNLLVQLEDSSEFAFEDSITTAELGVNLEVTSSKAAFISGTFDYASYIDEVNIGSGFKLSVLGTDIEQVILAGDSFAFALPAGAFKIAFSPSDSAIVKKLQELQYADTVIYQEISVDLTSGDTLHLGDIRWVMGEKPVNAWKNGSTISGRIVNAKNEPVAGVAVRLITDIYGFSVATGVTSSTTESQVYSDSLGFWSLPFPTQTLYDSLRVEATTVDGDIAVSRFVMVDELKQNEGKDISLGSLKLTKPANLDLEFRLVINKEDSTQTDNCLMNGIVVGLVGTDRFVRMVTCDQVILDGLPIDEQPLVYYTSDQTVLETLWERSAKPESYMTFVHFVGLAPNDTLENQVVTYTPPTL